MFLIRSTSKSSIDTFSLSRTVFEIFDFNVFRVWPWPLTFRGYLRSKFFPPFESPYMIFLSNFYWHFLSISYRFWDIWLQSFLGFDLDLRPFFRCHLRSKIFSLFESPYMTSYLTSIDTFSQSCTVFEIFDIKVFRVWPWPLTSKGHLGLKNFIPFKSRYMTSYLTAMDTISLSRTVFEIFDLKVFRVWPWPLTSKGHLGSNIFIPFGSPYMTFYLTSMDTTSLSRTVFEIFDFKVFRVWPWPLTSKGHPGSKNFIPFESPYMTCVVVNKNLEGWEHCTHELNGQVSKEGDGRVEGNGNWFVP